MATGTSAKPKTEKPKLVLRTFQESDLKGVQAMFRETYFALVPEGVRRKLWSPLTWILWFAMYSLLLSMVPALIFGRHPGTEDSWPEFGLKLFLSAAWGGAGFAVLFIIVDSFETPAYVEDGLANDLADPEMFYLNHTKNADKLERKPNNDQTLSHFWVLRIDGILAGMVGLAHFDERLINKKPNEGKLWQQIGKAICKRLHLPVIGAFNPSEPYGIFAEAHEPKTASLKYLAVDNSLQGRGLSTLLIDRALTFAAEHGIKHVNATVNELQMQAEQVLTKRHGFQKVKKVSTGWFGQSKTYLVCDVDHWLRTYSQTTKEYYKPIQKK